jgi:hypothetical protein
MKSILLLLVFAWVSTLNLWSQETIDLSVQAYTVGQYQRGRMAPVAATPALQQHCQRQVARLVPANGADLQWQSSELIEQPGQGWQYRTYWQQGNARIAARFQALLREGEVQVLEVGSYQVCHCEDCSEVTFAERGSGCACESQRDCSFLMGETLH